ncbi:MAG: site-specific DNA-methyltransferase [Alphaproteobacteria bacterium]|nr:site-specific DNA-methyltransferase [Alphaproteobacteria bacterium]
MNAPTEALRTLLHVDVDVPDTPLVVAWVDAVRARVLARRASGLGTWRTAPDGAAWLDTGVDAALRGLADRVLGAAVRTGPVSAADIVTLDRAAADVAAAVERAWQAWTAPRALDPHRVLVPVETLDVAARARLDAHVASWRDAVQDGWLDTASLDDRLVAPLVAALADPAVRIVVGDNRPVLRALATEGLVVDAVVEDPPYDSGSPDLTYDDTFPPGAWRATLAEHLALVAPLLAPHGQVVVHIDEHRAADLQDLMRATFGVGHLGSVVWDKRNPKGDARGLAAQHERIEWAVRDVDALAARGGLRRPKAHAVDLLATASALVATHGVDAARPLWRAHLRTVPGLSEGTRAYRELDETGRPYRKVSLAWPNKRRPPDAYFTPVVHPTTGQPCPVPRRGWRHPPSTLSRMAAEGRLRFGPDHTTQPTRILRLDEVLTEPVPSVLYHAGADDARLAALGLHFPFSKPVALVRRLLATAAPAPHSVVLDGFAGSGSTAVAALEDAAEGLPRRVVLVEADAGTVDRVLLPRLLAALRERPLPGAWIRVDALA